MMVGYDAATLQRLRGANAPGAMMGHAEFTLRSQPTQRPLSLDELSGCRSRRIAIKRIRASSSRPSRYEWNDRGERIIDASSGLFCVAAGHGARRSPTPCTGSCAISISSRRSRAHPKSLNWRRASPSSRPATWELRLLRQFRPEAVDTAMKVALAYHQARGQAGQHDVRVARACVSASTSAVSHSSGIVNNLRTARAEPASSTCGTRT
jgi:hypothetical protein